MEVAASGVSVEVNQTAETETMAARAGRPPDIAGNRRKAALVSAWGVVSALPASAIAARLRVRLGSFYALVDPARQHNPSSKALRAVAILLREHSSKLTAEADRLEAVADQTDQ